MENVSRRNLIKIAGTGAIVAGAAPLIGNEVSWKGKAGSYPIAPYTLSAGAIEKFRIRERISMTINGLGHEVVEMSGHAVFRRHSPTLAAGAEGASLGWSTAEVRVDFLELNTSGRSKLFGTVSAALEGNGTEGAVVVPSWVGHGSYESMSYSARNANNKCDALISPKFEISALNETVSLGSNRVRLASEVSLIPPVGDVARTTGSYPLYDSHGQEIGQLLGADIEIGEILDRKPLASTL